MNKKLVAFLILLFHIVALPLVFASEINFTSIPSEVMVLTDFEVYSTFAGLDGGTTYYIKALGGLEGSNYYDIQTHNNEKYLSWNASWDDFPQFSTDSNGSGSIIVKCRFKEGTSISSNQFKVRIRKVGTSDNIDSETVPINVLPQPTEIPEPTSESTPTEVPTPTNTPKPTSVPSATKTPTPKPTAKIVNKSTSTPTSIPTLVSKAKEATGLVLGQQEVIGSSSTSGNTKELTQPSLITGAKISLILGLLFCGTAVIVFTQRVQNLKKVDDKT